MSAPVLNRRLVLEHAMQVADGAGGATEVWGVLGTLWAEVRASTGREVTSEAGSASKSRFRIIVRAAPAGASNRPVAGQRFRDGGRVFNIVAVSEHDRTARFLRCDAVEEVSL